MLIDILYMLIGMYIQVILHVYFLPMSRCNLDPIISINNVFSVKQL